MDPLHPMGAIASVIQLAVAPVFLLTGIAGLLAVLSTRLHRIVDRAREVERRVARVAAAEQRDLLLREAGHLWRRIRVINWSIRLSVGSALLVCLVVVALFLADVSGWSMGATIAGSFTTAMVLLIVSLVLLLVEVSVSTRHMRLGLELSMEEIAASGPERPREE